MRSAGHKHVSIKQQQQHQKQYTWKINGLNKTGDKLTVADDSKIISTQQLAQQKSSDTSVYGML